MPKRTTGFRDDLLVDLADPREASSYLNAALEDSEEMFLVALRDVAEARQMAKVAKSAGIARESVYRMLTVEGNPTYNSLLGILGAVGLRLAIRPGETETPKWSYRQADLQAGEIMQTEGNVANSAREGCIIDAASGPRKGMTMGYMARSVFQTDLASYAASSSR